MRVQGLLAVIALCASALASANPCALPGQYQEVGSGMGGTGHAQDGSGTGGTGVRGEEGGIGGTGHRNDGSGMGGTGDRAEGGMGGTGVVGVITGFGSICVNGIELHYDANTPVLVDGEKKTPEHLAIGQLVAVDADGQGQSLKARQIAVYSMLAGPVGWVSPTGESFVALGQTVRLDAATAKGQPGRAWRPKVGDHVRVNGLPESSGVIRATSIERIAPGNRVSLQGRVDTASGGVARIGNMVVTAAKSLRSGDFVRISGRMDKGVLRAERVEAAGGLGLSPRAGRVVLHGIAHAAKEAGTLSLGYADLRVPPGVGADRVAKAGAELRVEAQRRPDGILEARRFVLDRPVREMSPRPGREGRDAEREGSARAERREREHVERPEREDYREYERPEKPERNGREDAIEKIDRPERHERPERVERPELPERIELPERPETPERIEIERPELPERPEMDD
jgi:hypothetical protein